LALEFSKPARFVEKRAHNEAEPILTTGVGAGSPGPKVQVEDDHDPVRTRLARLFAADAQLRVVSRAEIGQDAVERMLRLTPDAVLVDVWVPTRAEDYAENPSERESPMFKVVVLAIGFGHETATAVGRRAEVSKRELSVLIHVAAGQSNKQIGKLLGISAQTVRNHMSRIFVKLGVSNRTEAVMSAVRLGLLSSDPRRMVIP
jgi:two-component system NarL family response regulator